MHSEQETPQPAARRRSFRNTFSAFRHRNYRLFFIGQLISVIGTWMQMLAQPWLVYQLMPSALLLGIIGALGTLPSLLLGAFGGALVDRLPKRTVIVCTQSTSMTLAFILAALVHWHVVQVWHVALVALCGGIVMAIDMPARQAFVVEMVGKDDLMNAIALNSSCFNLGRILGPTAAGLVMVVGMDWCFFINGLSFIAVIAGLLLMRLPKWTPSEMHDSILRNVQEGIAYVRTQRDIQVVLGLIASVAIFGFSYQVLMPVFARDILQVDPRGYGLMASANGIGALAAALIIASRRRPSRRLLFGTAFALATAIYGFSLSQTFILSIALLICIGGCGMTLIASCNTSLQLAVPDEMRGRVMGLYALSFAGMGPLGSLQAGALAHALGAPWAVCISACACAVVAFTLAVLVRSHHRRPQGSPAA
jgi:MFS family permease